MNIKCIKLLLVYKIVFEGNMVDLNKYDLIIDFIDWFCVLIDLIEYVFDYV